MWLYSERLKKGRWWFFWNFVVRGKWLRFRFYCNKPEEDTIDAVTLQEVNNGNFTNR